MCTAILKKRTAILWSAVLYLIVLTAASYASAEVSSGSFRSETMPVAQAANPCAAKNPCAMKAANPCAAKNPCAAGVPIDPALVTRPADSTPFTSPQTQLIQEGKRLWNDRTLSTSGMACQTCHLNHANFNSSFAKPYPHPVAMTQQRAGVQQVHLDEMVQFCMVVPMASQPFPWDSKELAALTAYAGQVQKEYIQAAAANPCNPCAAKNPCATKTVNPCAAKNPCAIKNPCAGR